MSTAKQIPALMAEDGSRATSWDSMAEITVNFFQKILGESDTGTNPPPVVDVSDPILEVVHDYLTADEKVALNAPFTVEELGEAARSMKKKCPGPDGIPVSGTFSGDVACCGAPAYSSPQLGAGMGIIPKGHYLGPHCTVTKKV